MENQKTNKMKLLVQKMQAYLDNFSKDNRKDKIDRKDYKKTHGKLRIEQVSEYVFNKLLKSRGYGDMSFKGTPDMGDRVTEIYEKQYHKDGTTTERDIEI